MKAFYMGDMKQIYIISKHQKRSIFNNFTGKNQSLEHMKNRVNFPLMGYEFKLIWTQEIVTKRKEIFVFDLDFIIHR